ncbi:RagB/SusD family nutrient uptake outer membrane protein [Pedobacter sp. MC2016-14]|uniref:RagB/SusD family nutrient uptake outer membrane protein n=1 Tax=Pedobacter sp. MC2016-14 TaxID=2897327 RepID=UPI001E407B53|nr:RagB/SusD family nutrient uptake outer membrane protein [Pedobacter sp. MC2016-14]MCD0490337.1 RagB/SusD family nutrient uptake outer membrane protein [Pedobacter sp. MC2016-14]
MKKYIILTLFIAVLSTGCKKLINGPDHSTLSTGAIFESARDLDNILYGAYGAIASGHTVAGNWKLFSELLADHVIVNPLITGSTPEDPYDQVYKRALKQAEYADNWRIGYTAIQNANTVIYAIENNLITKEIDPEYSDVTRDKMLGEAYFIRGLCHFELVRFYGKQYQFSTPSTPTSTGIPSPNNSLPNSGVILRTKPSINITKADDIIGQGRATVEETYQLIISDLKKAEDLLPASSLQGLSARRGRATNYAARAILARVYFQQNDFVNAKLEIAKVIGDVPGSITTAYTLVRANAAGATPSLANAQANVIAPFSSTGVITARPTEVIYDLVGSTVVPVNTVLKTKYVQVASTTEAQLAVSATFIADANFNANDTRLTRLITTVASPGGPRYYTRKYDQAAMNVPVIRSVEMILDRAEINAMEASTLPNGSAQHLAALADLVQIRSRVIVNAAAAYPTATTINSTQILAEVRKERIRELAFEGDRFHNLRRLGALGVITNIPNGDRTGAEVLSWNSNKLLFKIPNAEIRSSNNVVQNPD